MTSGRGLLTGWFCMSLSTWVSVIRWQTFVADHMPMQLVNRDGGGSSAGGAHVAWDGLYFFNKSKHLLQPDVHILCVSSR